MSDLRLAERASLDETAQREKRAIAENLQKRVAAVEEQYRLPLFNLKANIEATAPLPRRREESRAKKERLLAVLEEMQAEKSAKINALYKEADSSFWQIMKSHEEESARRLKEAAERLRPGDVLAEHGEALRLWAPETVYGDIAALEKELTEQRIAKDRLYSRMRGDIASQAARLAAQNSYAAVLADVMTNIAAEDITDKVIAGLPDKE
jgi:hypothetical protein